MSGVETELEAKLAVVDPDLGAVLDAVAGVAALGGYRLGPPRPARQRDTYFDTADRALSQALVAVRVRRCGSAILLAFKGPDRRAGRGTLVEREELEGRWSPALLRDVLERLRATGVPARAPRAADPGAADTPERALAAAGLKPIQQRETQRRTRVASRQDGTAVAELAIDCVTHELDGECVRLGEIEVEALPGGSAEDIERLVAALRRIFTSLRPWRHDKLATGLALAALAGDDPQGFAACVTRGALAPEGFARIEVRLARDGGPLQGTR